MCPRARFVRVDLKAMGRRIRGLRGDVRQQDLAVQLGISQAQLSKIESGAIAPSVACLLWLSLEFNKSIHWIVTGEER